MEIAFLCIFAIELLLRILVSGPAKFFAYANEDFSWSANMCHSPPSLGLALQLCERNLFDFCVVIAGFLDVMFDFSPVRHEKAELLDSECSLSSRACCDRRIVF